MDSLYANDQLPWFLSCPIEYPPQTFSVFDRGRGVADRQTISSLRGT